MKDLTLPTPPVTVRVLDTAIWIESDMFGAWHVVVQHEGMDAFTFATFNYRYGYTDNASTHAAAVQMAIDLGATEPVEERQRGDNFADAILAIRNGEVEYKSWEPVSNHEDGRAEPVWCSCGDAIMPDTGAKCGVCASGVALGGEKGDAVAGEKLNELLDAYAEIAHQNGVEFCAGNEGDLEGELTAKRAVLALFAATVCKARMLTDEEADHITGMHNTGRSQGDSECAEAIQRKFCEVNGITLEAK